MIFAACPECRRDVQTMPRPDGPHFRVHSGRFSKWCPMSRKPVGAAIPVSKAQLEEWLRNDDVQIGMLRA
jgi:hypothetical protein